MLMKTPKEEDIEASDDDGIENVSRTSSSCNFQTYQALMEDSS